MPYSHICKITLNYKWAREASNIVLDLNNKFSDVTWGNGMILSNEMPSLFYDVSRDYQMGLIGYLILL